jgi:hypothetical protein
LVTVPIILDQAVSNRGYYFGSGCWLLFPLFWIRLLVNVSIILDLGTVTNNLTQNNGNSNHQPDTKKWEQ